VTETVRGRVAISFALVAFVAAVGMSVIFLNVFHGPLNTILDAAADNASNEHALTMIGHVRTIIDYSLLWGIGLAGFGFLMDAAYQGGRT
jgi:hypothetical protein